MRLRLLGLAVLGLAAVAGGLGPARAQSPAGIDSEAYWQEAWKQLARLGNGYIVWESNRTGSWRIWRINLDGSGLRQLSPEEPNRDHLCPHISPNGKRVVYVSTPKGVYPAGALPNGAKAPLHLMSADGRFDRVIVEDVRSYGGDRAVVWLSSDELIYINRDRVACRLNLTTLESEPLLKEAQPDDEGNSWLINAKLRHATSGRPIFSPYDPQSRTISPRTKQGGCEPYFTHDGVWGFWMGGAGGPVNRYHLATDQISPIIGAKDPRLPKERSYVYFPMVSRCGRLFAFAASPDQHDHDTSDYDVFVCRIDPRTLELIGKPARYTFDKATDRYPDVFLADLELGDQSGEAPFTVKLTAKPASGSWTWRFGDEGSAPAGSRPTGPSATHTYTRPGDYEVEARQGDRVLRGRVVVTPARPPRPVAAMLQSDREILVAFDEPVRPQGITVRLASGAKVTSWKPAEDGRSLRVQLAAKLAGADKLVLEGVTDRAQKPNRLPKTLVDVRPVMWPVSGQNLIFAWETGDKPNRILGGSAQEARASRVRSRGRAWFDRSYAMRLAGGAFLAEDVDAALLAACKKTNALTLEAVIRPDGLKAAGPARILSFSSDPNSRNFTLGQQEDKLILRLRTPRTGENGTNPEVTLCALSTSEPNHIVITYSPGKLVCYRNGKPTLTTDQVQGDFSNWAPHHLIFGNEWTNDRPWPGVLEGVAIYNRVLRPEEVQSDYQQYRRLLAARKPAPRLQVEAKLVARSRIPTLQEIQPYRDALVTCEYEVAKVLSGKCGEKRIRVAHWALLDGETLPVSRAKVGATTRLTLEPFAANPQLQSIYLSDSLEENWDAAPFFDVGGL